MRIEKNSVKIYENEEEVRASLETEIHMARLWLSTSNKKLFNFYMYSNIKNNDILKYFKTRGVFFYKQPIHDKHSRCCKSKHLYKYIMTLNNKGEYYFKRFKWIRENTKGTLYHLLSGLHFGYSFNKIIKFCWRNR